MTRRCSHCRATSPNLIEDPNLNAEDVAFLEGETVNAAHLLTVRR